MPKLECLQQEVAFGLSWQSQDCQLLAAGQSPYQQWEIWDSPVWGRLYRLDADCMATERDEFMGHEPLVHIAGLAHGAPRRAIVLGGGDGASARELLRYPDMACVQVLELDEQVVQQVTQHIPSLSQGAFEDPRVQLVIGDAYEFVLHEAATHAPYDLMIYDLTDAVGIASALFSEAFLQVCKQRLAPRGAICMQLGSPLYQAAQCAQLYHAACRVFRTVRVCLPWIPSYGGAWAMAILSDSIDPCCLTDEALQAGLRHLGPLRALNCAQYRALLACPPWLEQALGQDQVSGSGSGS